MRGDGLAPCAHQIDPNRRPTPTSLCLHQGAHEAQVSSGGHSRSGQRIAGRQGAHAASQASGPQLSSGVRWISQQRRAWPRTTARRRCTRTDSDGPASDCETLRRRATIPCARATVPSASTSLRACVGWVERRPGRRPTGCRWAGLFGCRLRRPGEVHTYADPLHRPLVWGSTRARDRPTTTNRHHTSTTSASTAQQQAVLHPLDPHPPTRHLLPLPPLCPPPNEPRLPARATRPPRPPEAASIALQHFCVESVLAQPFPSWPAFAHDPRG